MTTLSSSLNFNYVWDNPPNRDREKYDIDKKVSILRAMIDDVGTDSIENMGVFSFPTIDIGESISTAIRSVQAKNLIDAMTAFAGICPAPREKEFRESAEEAIRQHPFNAFVSSMMFDSSGHIIAKQQGLSTEEECENAVTTEMIHHFDIQVGLAVKASILPALEVLLMEHRLREAEFVELAIKSPIVPLGRERLFGKALYLGYNREFVQAIHILVPQIEHMVRFHLRNAGVPTSHIDRDGIQTEVGLSALINLAETKKIFGEDLTFEIKSLFCDSRGANLRNQIAHGLLSDAECLSAYAIYAWWFGLRLVFAVFLNTARSQMERTDGDGESESDS